MGVAELWFEYACGGVVEGTVVFPRLWLIAGPPPVTSVVGCYDRGMQHAHSVFESERSQVLIVN